jgi:hypothetical protein
VSSSVPDPFEEHAPAAAQSAATAAVPTRDAPFRPFTRRVYHARKC